jgi:hypothetical protein
MDAQRELVRLGTGRLACMDAPPCGGYPRRMIVATGWDDALEDKEKTQYVARMLATYATSLHERTDGRFALVRATGSRTLRRAFQEALETERTPVFYFGHGRNAPPALVDHRKEAVIGEETPWDRLTGRLLFAVSCHSADGIARELRSRGATVVGWRGKFLVPKQETQASQMVDAALAGPLALANGATAAAAKERARLAFEAHGKALYTSRDDEDFLCAPLMDMNAVSVRVVGDGKKRHEG